MMAKGTIRGVLMGAAASVTGLAALSIMSGPPQNGGAVVPPAQISTPSEAAMPATPEQQTPPEQTAADTADATPQPQADVTTAEVDPAPQAAPQSAPDAVALEVPAGSGFNMAREDEQAVLPPPDIAPDTSPAPVLDAQSEPPVAGLSLADRSPAATPPVDQGGADMATPPEPDSAPAVAMVPTQIPPAQTSPRSIPPSAPQQPALQEASPQIAPRGPAIADAPQQPEQDQAETDERPVTQAGTQAGTQAVTQADRQTPRVPYSTAPTPQRQPEAMPEPAPQPSRQRQALPVIDATPPAVTPDQTAPGAPVAPADMAPVIRPSIGTLATSLVDRPATGTPDSATAASGADAAGMVTPLRQNALAFDDPDARPRLSIILIDRGDSVVDAAALQGFPYPLTFAVDAARPDAAEASARYRAAGFEVMALIDLDPASTAQDVEIAMEVSLSAVPDAVAVMEGDATGFQSGREISDQVAAILAQRGYGLVMLPNGLNTAQKLAAKAGVPSATVFRDFDGAGQDAAAIRRFLDQGAFKAGQRNADGTPLGDDDGVIMMGRLRPDTISALLLWGLQDRARRVALAPVSALLLANDAP